jgi:hypothetical protein
VAGGRIALGQGRNTSKNQSVVIRLSRKGLHIIDAKLATQLDGAHNTAAAAAAVDDLEFIPFKRIKTWSACVCVGETLSFQVLLARSGCVC